MIESPLFLCLPALLLQNSLGDAVMLAGARLTVLDLSDNAFGPDGVKGIEKLLKSSACYTLQELRLNNCGMGIGGGKVSQETKNSLHDSHLVSFIVAWSVFCDVKMNLTENQIQVYISLQSVSRYLVAVKV